MLKGALLLVPVLALQAQDSVIPRAVEVRSGVFVLKGTPDDATCQALKRYRFTHVLDLRRDDEPNLNCESESARMQDLGIQYQRYTIAKAPSAADFDFLRMLLRDLPRGSRILVHCSNGNRAAAAVCPWLVLDKGMPVAEALQAAADAGMTQQDTRDAVRRYLQHHGRV